MSETTDVLAAISAAAGRGRKMALATIVAVRGSTYRRPGARLLVSEDGDMVGNLSGGCLEGEVAREAEAIMAEDRPRLMMYDLTADDEVIWGWGLGCNGAIEVFIEPSDRAAEVADALRRAIEEERPIGAATVLETSVDGVEQGARMLIHPDGTTEGGTGSDELDRACASAGGEALAEGRTYVQTIDASTGSARVFLEAMEPPPRLLVCGAGHDAIPMVRVASELGWRVVVVDDREAMLTAERFPTASKFVRSEPALAAATAGIDTYTHAVVMSHNYLRDRDYLKSFLGSGVRYLGMLGPQARLDRLLDDLASDGIKPDASDMISVHGPAGLDIGAEGPDEIALAIVAEILAVSRGKPGGSLRDRSGPIHERRAERAPATG